MVDVSGTVDYPACDACEFAIGVLLDVCYLPRRGMGAHCVFMMDELVDVSVSVDVSRPTSQVCCNGLYDVPSDIECCVGDILRDLGALGAQAAEHAVCGGAGDVCVPTRTTILDVNDDYNHRQREHAEYGEQQ